MPWIMQMLGFGLLLIGVAVALWVSIWVLAFFFVIGLGAVIWSHLRDYLIAKGILNPNFGASSAEGEMPQITIVEGEFTRVEEQEKVTKE